MQAVEATSGRRGRRAPAAPAAAKAAARRKRRRRRRTSKPVDASLLKDAFLGEIRKAKKFFYGTVVAQAQRIDFEGDKVVFVFGPQHRALRAQLEQNRAVARGRRHAARRPQDVGDRRRRRRCAGEPGRRLARSAVGAAAGRPDAASRTARHRIDQKQSLKERALSDTGVQTMLDVFAARSKTSRRCNGVS